MKSTLLLHNNKHNC